MTPTAQSDRSSLLANFSALAGGHALGLVVPLLTVPYLARVLRPEGWAPVLVAQALAAWLLLLLDYGFDLSATRAIAQARGSLRDISEIVWSVQYAKLLLAPVAIVLMVIAYALIPALQDAHRLMLWTVLFGLVRGLNPLWFFQGMEQMRGAVLTDTAAKVLGALSVFVFVRAPGDGWKVLALQALFAGLACAVLTLRLVRLAPATPWSIATAIAELRRSWPLFVFRASGTLYMQANTIILSVSSTALAVAAYGGAERIVRAAINLLEPMTRLFLPHISFLASSNPRAAARLISRCLLVLGVGSAFAGAMISFGAPWLVQLLLGHGYEAAVPVLRWLALLLPVVTLATVLGAFWALPHKRDKLVLGATLVAGVTNLALAALLVPRIDAMGMTIAVVSAESIVATTLALAYVRWRREAPAESVVVS
ncbi:MAG: oligosaccharide flippase family protein [Gemmatimonadaceae bacterium]